MVDTAWYYALRLALFSAIGFGTIAEFFCVIGRVMWQLADLFGKEVK